MKKDSRNHSRVAVDRSRKLRREMSVSEIWFWEIVRKKRLGFGFRRQVPVGPYILDFYCAEAKLCVEVDGEQHALSRDRDEARDRFLLDRGIETLRIPSLDLFDEVGVLKDEWRLVVLAKCEERSGREGWE